MKKIILAFALVLAAFNYAAEPIKSKEQPLDPEESVVLFTPPMGWHMADPSELPPHIRIMVLGKGPSTVRPSLSLNIHSYDGTLKQYLKMVKATNEAQGYEWKDLGTIRTEAGNASLSQFDQKNPHGVIRLMQVILIKNKMAYVLTASSLADEFSLFYKDFFAAMRSLRVTKDPIDLLTSSQQKTQLRNAIQSVKSQWLAEIAKKKTENTKKEPQELAAAVFNSPDFQKSVWLPFKEMISQKYGMMGADWQNIVLNNTEKDLFDTQIN